MPHTPQYNPAIASTLCVVYQFINHQPPQARLEVHRQLLVGPQHLSLRPLADGQCGAPLPRLTVQLRKDVDVGQVGLQWSRREEHAVSRET